MKEFKHLKIDMIFSLYKQKRQATEDNNGHVLNALYNTYPSLFSFEFDYFIQEVKHVMSYLNMKYGQDLALEKDAPNDRT